MASLGERLLELWGGGAKRSYTVKGWHAQLAQLTSTRAGYQAADQVGLSVTRRTLLDWLTERRAPSIQNQRLISQAYSIAAGRWQPAFESQGYSIRGLIDSGDRDEERTLKVGLGDYGSAIWVRLEAIVNDGAPPKDSADFRDYTDLIEDVFIEDVIEMDIGTASPEWGFPGDDYTVTVF